MRKDGKFWFDHDYQARNDDKILELRAEFGAEGYGIFWMIIETMADNDAASIKLSLIGGLSHGYGVTKDKLLKIIQFSVSIGLLIENEGFISSKRVKNHKIFRKEISDKSRAGAEKRWDKKNATVIPPHSHPNTTALPPQSHPNAHDMTIHNNDNTVLEPMTEKEFKEFSEKLKIDQLFLEPLFASGLKPEFLEKWIIRFHVHIVGEEKINKNYGEYRKHFKNWLNKQEFSQPPPALTPLEKIKTISSHIKSEKETDFDKYKK